MRTSITPASEGRQATSWCDAERVHRVPECVREQARDRCVAAIGLRASRIVSLLGSETIVQRGTANPLHHIGRLRAK